MLTCFNLKPGESIADFRQALQAFAAHLEAADLLNRLGPIGERQTNTIMDTDEERDHQYFFIMSFKDRDQCDRSVSHLYRKEAATEKLHTDAYDRIADPVFICWQDLD